MSEYVEEVVDAADLKEGDRVRITTTGVIDKDGDLRVDTDEWRTHYIFARDHKAFTFIRLTPKPVLPTKRNALVQWTDSSQRFWLALPDGFSKWVDAAGDVCDDTYVGSRPFTVIFAGEDDQ